MSSSKVSAIIWGAVALLSLAFLLAQQPRDLRLWLLLLVAAGATGLSLYSWKSGQ
jgi:hypothetical protein